MKFQSCLPAIVGMVLIRTAWCLMLEHTAVWRRLRGRPHLCPVESNFIFDLLPLFFRHAPKFNGCKQKKELKLYRIIKKKLNINNNFLFLIS